MAWKDFETRLKAKYRKQTRTITTAVEDCYLRDDIPCGSALCTSCAPTTSHLAASASFLMIPDSATLSTYLEILELPEISNYIILSSELRKFAVKSNMRKSARMRALYRDKRRHCFLFNDMNCMQIHDMTRTPLAHQQQGQDPPSDLPPGVRVVSTQECFTSLWGHCQAVADLFDSLNQAKKQEGDGVGPPATGGEVSYKQYCTQQVLEEGLAAGEFLRAMINEVRDEGEVLEEGLAAGGFLRGSFQVSKRNPFEAVVQVGSSSDSQLGRLIQVSGRAAMNRAMHGDTVAVRLLPMSFTVVSKTDEEPHVDGAPSKQNVDDLDFAAELMDTVVGENDMELEARGQLAHGEVVGILLQQSIDIVACVSSQDEEALTKREEGDNRQSVPDRLSAYGACASSCALTTGNAPQGKSYFVRVRTHQAVRLGGMRFVLRIDNWERSSRYPNGHISKILGPIHELKAESEAVLVQCGINWQPFCQGAMAELPIVPEPSKWRAAPEELAVRRDLRGPEYFVVSIDPVGCTDIDDAMHVSSDPVGCTDIDNAVHVQWVAGSSMIVRSSSMLAIWRDLRDPGYFVVSSDPVGCMDINDTMHVRWVAARSMIVRSSSMLAIGKDPRVSEYCFVSSDPVDCTYIDAAMHVRWVAARVMIVLSCSMLVIKRDPRGPGYFVVSSDPVGCMDIDDTMHVRWVAARSMIVRSSSMLAIGKDPRVSEYCFVSSDPVDCTYIDAAMHVRWVAARVMIVLSCSMLVIKRDPRGPGYFVVSSDPVGCMDIDDTMHVRWVAARSMIVRSSSMLAIGKDPRVSEYCFVSSDPVGCTYIDAAMHVRFIEEGSQEVADLARLSILRRGRMPARLIEVGVHIADVSYFVRPGGLLDGEARDRCTSVYLVDRRLDMLPSLLSEHLCSLRSKSERYSMSVIWVLDADTLEPVVKPWFGRTVISSRHELHYQQAQDVLDGLPPVAGDGLPAVDQPVATIGTRCVGWPFACDRQWPPCCGTATELMPEFDAQDVLDGLPPAPGDGLPAVDRPVLLKSLQLLKVLTDKRHARRVEDGALELTSAEIKFKRRANRVEDGALELTSAEIKFKVDESGQPCSGTAKKHIPMMDVVAEMMIMANAGVAQRIAETFPGCALLRNHPPPRQEAFDQVRSILETGGDQQVDPSSNRSLSQALAAVCERAQDPALAQLIKSMITRAMSEAKYFSTGAAPPGSSGSYHYGLALPYYTHFTSPIRRYADVIVHRQLMAALAASESGVGLPPMQHAELALAASAMNERHREAKAASKECSEMYLLLLLHNHPHAERALVVSVQDNSVEVYVQKYHLKGRVRMVDSKGKVGMPLLDDVEDDKDPFSSSTEVADLRYSTHNTTAQIHRLDCASAGSEEGGSLVWQFLADTHPLVLEARATTSQPSPSSMSSGGRGVPAATPLIGGHGRPPSQAAAAPSAGAHPGGGGSAYPTKSTHAAANESSAPLVDFAAASGDAGRTSLGDGRILTDPMGFLSPSHYKGAASLGGMTNEGGIDPLCRIADGDSYVGLTTSSSLEGVGHLSGSNADEAVALNATYPLNVASGMLNASS
eukprot:gene16297-22485_t